MFDCLFLTYLLLDLLNFLLRFKVTFKAGNVFMGKIHY